MSKRYMYSGSDINKQTEICIDSLNSDLIEWFEANLVLDFNSNTVRHSIKIPKKRFYEFKFQKI